MPYINKADRLKYRDFIRDVMALIPPDLAALEQGERFAYFTDVVIQELKQSLDRGHYAVGSGLEATFREHAKKLTKILPANLDLRAGDLNYVLSMISWGLCGYAPERKPAKYCLRSFIKGGLWRALLSNQNTLTGAEYVFFAGVITDVIDEMYRRCTAPYEDYKMQDSGDIVGDLWP